MGGMDRLRALLQKVNWHFYRHPYFDKFTPAFFKAWFHLSPMSQRQHFLFNTLYSGWTRPTGREKVLSKDHFRWQHYTSARYNRELTKFMFSFASETSVTRNVNNLLFLTGPESSGKSWFLNYNLSKMREAKIVLFPQDPKPLIFHINLRQNESLNFDTFVERLEREIVDGVVQFAESLKGKMNE